MQSKGSSGVYVYQPHQLAITDIAMSSSQALPRSHLLSTSVDGTLRSIDLENSVMDLVSGETTVYYMYMY